MREKAQFEVKKREREARLCEEARLKKEADKAAARQVNRDTGITDCPQ